MAEGVKEAIVNKLLDSVPMALVVLGAVFVLLGLAGGITYQQWLPISDEMPRIASGLIGAVLIGVGIFRSHISKPLVVQPIDYSIKILSPTTGSQVTKVDVSGSIKKKLPDGYCLRVFRALPGRDILYPLRKARIDIDNKTWLAEQCDIGGAKGEQRSFVVYLCGPNAEALLDFHSLAVSEHDRTMRELLKATGNQGNYLPWIKTTTRDMHECCRVSVTRS